MAIADIRRDYTLGDLDRADLEADPLAQFNRWFAQASAQNGGSRLRKIGIAFFKVWQAMLGHSPADVNAMVLATVDKNGFPSARTVLLKGVDARGFIFFTNYDSRKGRELLENPNAALTFYWPELERQVCVSGMVAKLPQAESEKYFKTRPKSSRLSAWASPQSQPVENRKFLENKLQEIEKRFPGADVPMPPNWGGYVLEPKRLEFWQGRPGRLHDRFCYERSTDGQWKIQRLAP
ncbi:MAG TPA: pyridoxamine 5'-phosphate oxidase [Verrucomicrobiae bacterium]|nr:pyridoxamine 5'-phosphate oxidase [Verrucomicrobiae bacterium]